MRHWLHQFHGWDFAPRLPSDAKEIGWIIHGRFVPGDLLTTRTDSLRCGAPHQHPRLGFLLQITDGTFKNVSDQIEPFDG